MSEQDHESLNDEESLSGETLENTQDQGIESVLWRMASVEADDAEKYKSSRLEALPKWHGLS